MGISKILFEDSDVLKVDEAFELFLELEEGKDERNESYDFLYSNLIECAIKYTNIRANWNLLSRDEKIEKDESRTATHDAFINACNALARCMEKMGLSKSWKDKLGKERKRIGDFACWITSIIAIRSR